MSRNSLPKFCQENRSYLRGSVKPGCLTLASEGGNVAEDGCEGKDARIGEETEGLEHFQKPVFLGETRNSAVSC